METNLHRFCIAPMMDWSDRHCRYFWRLLSRHARLYTEMITSAALVHGNHQRLLDHHPAEHPLAVQLGGSEAAELAAAAKICERAGYDEINLNVGCPSERVQSGAFGACLMHEPETVANGVKAMREAVDIPVTIKCRLGVDDNDSYQALCDFVGINRDAGCKVFIVHARKAWLKGLSPKQNREVPPLNYPRVFQLKKDFPELQIVLNGGLQSLQACQSALDKLDGVMLGREAYHNPFLLAGVDGELFDEKQLQLNRVQVATMFVDYIERELKRGTRLNHMTRHVLGLFNGEPNARKWRRYLSENAYKPGAGIEVYLNALQLQQGNHARQAKLSCS
ncbi:MAG: tRNA dihydrouridine(20/20a) synthase DusA [Gammaproteobacteria bacterium]|nr:tRNA dihydrouridine(20/20a) synthase DusA [Gammaproteobacteria bacterium]MBT8151957.1 tRNA dihydrouridine(20/20a) synthase DusA [Gammaproteobacteria bacterium]NND39525.1 tRNA dihydrouridine(20/20a) synthase DusA [Pseudomonadales bacterium]NNL11971.1 tRNA dihydrouridine(20/20a) synthase DusA [Pseudomonadales bacterium]NNM11860.1 tRNA dihydrouridine(20/20a) synthase DusA [Pseudomonadales bacterium]